MLIINCTFSIPFRPIFLYLLQRVRHLTYNNLKLIYFDAKNVILFKIVRKFDAAREGKSSENSKHRCIC